MCSDIPHSRSNGKRDGTSDLVARLASAFGRRGGERGVYTLAGAVVGMV